MKEIENQKSTLSSEIPVSYIHLNQGKEKPLLLFLHGYADSARSFLRRAFPDLDEEYEILAINGLFPVPQKVDGVWKEAFAWYFADFDANSILIHPEVSAKAVVHLLEKFNLTHRTKVVIGFSQGGFFIPFLLPHLKEVKHLIGIGAAYKSDNYPVSLDVTLDAVHGTDDEIVPFTIAQKSFENFASKKNPNGQFVAFQGLGHKMNDESRAWLKEKLKQITE